MSQSSDDGRLPTVHHDNFARRILVVDDNRDGADTLRQLLEMLGAEVEAAYDGSTALAAMNAEPPDVVLLDLEMPIIDGYELAELIRQEAAFAEIYLVALTGWDRQVVLQRALSAGCDEVWSKPVGIKLLNQLVAGRYEGFHER